jgi:transient receptor potential cation channel subfamily M protein 5
VEHATPWLILAGSGGIADVLAALVNQPHLLVPQVVEQQFREKFPGEHFSWEAIGHWTKLVGAAQGLGEEGLSLLLGWG